MKNNLCKFALAVCFVMSALPSFGALSGLDPIRDKEITGADNIAESSSFARTGSVIAKASEQDPKSEEQKKAIEKLRSDLKSAAIREVSGFAKLINEKGTKSAIETIDKNIQQKGITPQKGTVNGVSYISYSFKPGNSSNSPNIVYQYSVHPGKNICQVIAAIPALKLQEAAGANYKEPGQKMTVAEKVGNYLGLAFSDKQEKVNGRNGFKVLNSDPKGLAGKAGIKNGDLIIKIDAFDITNDHTVDRISAYIDGRIQKKTLLKIVVMRNGAKKNFEIQL